MFGRHGASGRAGDPAAAGLVTDHSTAGQSWADIELRQDPSKTVIYQEDVLRTVLSFLFSTVQTDLWTVCEWHLRLPDAKAGHVLLGLPGKLSRASETARSQVSLF